ncbi:MAG: MBG domain-containing protein, partial [Gemmatimonadetes bacterium]|nr:MBG domain-containing protein [Gemmatimonadota bacterium]
ITTAQGHSLTNVPISWTVTAGGGTIAREDTVGGSLVCNATVGSSFDAVTNTSGKSHACWTLGAIAGTNTVTATASAGGDAPAGVTFVATGTSWTTTAAKAVATLTLSGLDQTYNGDAKSVTVTTTPASLSLVNVTYGGSTTAPKTAGSYAVVATLDNPSYQGTASGTLVIAQASQLPLSITSPAPGAAFGGTVQLSTDGGSGTGTVTYDATGSTACTVTAGGLVSITHGTGTCSVTASKAADTNYGSVSSSAFTLTVSKKNTTITLSNLGYTYDTTPKSATATTDPAGLAGVAITYDASATAPTNAGNYAVAASLDNPDYAAPTVTGTLTIAKANQATLLVNAPPSATFNSGTVQLTTSGGNGGGAVTYDASTTPLVCSVNATSGALTILVGTGSCVVSAAKAGDTNYNGTTSATASITLNKGSQSITFSPLGGKTYGDAAFSVNATASSSLAVSFAAGATDKCTVSGNTVTLTGAGNCTITASQAGNGNFAAATPVPQTFAIAQKAATATAGSGSMNFGSAVPSLPCVVSGLLGSDAVTCSTTVPAITVGTLVTTASLNAAAAATNYLWNYVDGALVVNSLVYTQYNCFASPMTSTAAAAKTAEHNSTVPLKCKLLDGSGRPVSTAKGNLTVQDKGKDGTTNGSTVFSATNVFRYMTSDDADEGQNYYQYNLSTSTNSYTRGHYYLVTATWTDGSTTKGWIFVK